MDIEAERKRIKEILACPGARMNPSMADHLANDTMITASVAIGVLAFSTHVNGTLPTDPVARALILACRELRSQGR
jgi:hypothetical protein